MYKDVRAYSKLPHSLCQSCANSVCGCSWSRDFVPVKGWIAEPTTVHMASDNGKVYEDESFLVKWCPLFRADEVRHTKTIRTDGVRTLCFRILWSATQDYANALIKSEKYGLNGKDHNVPYQTLSVMTECESFFRSEFAEDMMDVLGIGVDPDALINAIKEDPHGVLRRIKSEMNPRKPTCFDYDDYSKTEHEN